MKFDTRTYRLTDRGRLGSIMIAAAVVGLLLSALGMIVDWHRFYFSYLVAFVFWVSLGLGGLFFTMLHHLVGATWSIVVRRISESLMMTLPVMALFFIPLIFGMHDLYHWTHAEEVAEDAMLQAKAGYLNQPFFIIRTAVYFLIWSLLAWGLYTASVAQDHGYREAYRRKMRRISGGGMVLFALTVSFAGFDWLMSLEPHWSSTIYGVYYFSGGLLASITLMTLIALGLRRNGVLSDAITLEHYHDLGKLMFGFTIFWGYIAFSQYLLIWYGNLPEETVWYLERWQGSWKAISLLIIFGGFTIPFIVLLFRGVKRRLGLLGLLAAWMLLMHWIDMFWLVLPTYPGAKNAVHFAWWDLTTMVGLGGVFLFVFWKVYSSKSLVPVTEPELNESIEFVNM
jgi:hypothetical protein